MKAWEVLGKERPFPYKVRDLVAAGLTDRQIAKALGRSVGDVLKACDAMGVVCDHTMRTTAAMKKARIRELHAQGMNDNQIAERVGATPETVCVYRSHMKLKVHSRPAPSKAAILRVIESARKMGARITDTEIAERLGKRPKCVSVIRWQLRKAGILPESDRFRAAHSRAA